MNRESEDVLRFVYVCILLNVYLTAHAPVAPWRMAGLSKILDAMALIQQDPIIDHGWNPVGIQIHQFIA